VEEITERQLAILGFIGRHIVDKSFPPTIREIGEAMGIRSTNGVNDHLKALEKKGFLERGELKSRSLVPTERAWARIGGVAPLRKGGAGAAPAVGANDDLLEVPLLGRVAAGAPLLAEEHREETLRIDPTLLGPGRTAKGVFALRVRGDSMIGDGILDGDLIFVRRQPTARAGEIVVAMIEGEATVKRYFPEGDRIRLQPSNPRLQPIYVKRSDARAAELVGVMVGLFRQVG